MRSLSSIGESDQSPECPSSKSSDDASEPVSQSSSDSSSPSAQVTPKAKSSTVRARKARFTSELEIIAAIDAKTALVEKLLLKAGQTDQRASAIFDGIQEWPDSEKRDLCAERATKLREEANRIRSRAERVRSNYLARLKGRLAVFRTGQLPAFDNHDQSVPK